MSMVINTKAIGKMDRDADKEFINTLMVIFTRENGSLILSKDKVDSKWLLVINIKDSGLKVKKMVLAYTYLLTAMFMKDSLKMETGKVKEAILGLIKAIIRVNGLLIK